MDAPYKNIHLIINPAAGKDEPILNILNRAFQPYDMDFEIRVTRKSGDATRFAQEAVAAGADLVAGYGGDGTQMEIANGLLGSDVPMAILPGGTGNSMAHDLKIPGDLKGAAELICQSASLRAVDLAQVGEQTFMLRAYTGTDEQDKASREAKDRLGNLAYIQEGIKMLKELPYAVFQLTVDGQEIEEEGISCLIFNAGSLGQYGQLHVEIQPDDGKLDVFILNTSRESVLAFTSYVLNIEDQTTGLHHWKGSEISVRADPPQPLWLDGEPAGKTPFDVKVIPKAIKVIVPEAG